MVSIQHRQVNEGLCRTESEEGLIYRTGRGEGVNI